MSQTSCCDGKCKCSAKSTAGGSRLLLVVAILLSAGVTFGVTALLVNIFEHKQEAKNPFFRVSN